MGVLLLVAPALPGQERTYNGSVQYSAGSYVFSERTHSYYLFSGIGVTSGRFRLNASIPLILQNSGLITYLGGTRFPMGGPDHEAVRAREPGMTIPGSRGRRAASGTDSVRFQDRYDLRLGDPSLHGSVEVHSGSGVIRSVLVSTGAKAPLANLDSGVGTGEWDLSAGTSLTVAAGDFFVFGDLAYWWFGDLPELELRDGLAYGFGIGPPIFGGRASLLGTVSGAESAGERLEAPMILGASVGVTMDGGRQISAGVSAGLTEASPDIGLFLGWTVPF